ncbi:hypothetical protein BJ875DRAFT_489015 [Amylocarpus encephaloides]|uniref:Extracellular membrane protein CFEM domain-containing protein n=1 Tax=Amylocarpus encephaloides TaxID=45428 RepID=A0A9P8C0X0_9HELO|nr:hypothetical protein BJ875DRAFT_489015 [Amylocarpus encephaloides]
MQIQAYISFLGTLLTIANAGGFVPPAEWCLPNSGLKELSGCIAMTNREKECGEKPTDDEKLNCFCVQEMLSSYYDCKSDITRCLESPLFNPQFDEKIRKWHELCDDRLTSTSKFTTPTQPTLTTTYDFGACDRLYQSCASADYETNECSHKYPSTSSMAFTSCFCQPPVYSLMSECQYNGNVSCKRTTAAESNIYGYSFCSSFWSGSQTMATVHQTPSISFSEQPTIQVTGQPTQIPSPTGFATQTATKSESGGPKHVGENVQEELK